VEGARLIRASVHGLMDRSLDEPDQARLREALDALAPRDVGWRALRTRRAGAQAWIDVVVLVPGSWTVESAHVVADEVEATLGAIVPNATIITHLEPHPR
jgi:divalent metal cation (Fe/Co/Zn/Cd) transporter